MIIFSSLVIALVLLAEEHIRELVTVFLGWIGVLFVACWTVVGSVLFWKYLLPSHSCENDVNTLMWFRLIAGILCVLQRANQQDQH
jgi:hypothetical protein